MVDGWCCCGGGGGGGGGGGDDDDYVAVMCVKYLLSCMSYIGF
jgi:hypothetical protein